MPPSPRYMVRLPPALHALVQARLATGIPFATLCRAALTAYLSAPEQPVSTRDQRGLPSGADTGADSLTLLTEQLATLTARVTALEQAIRGADTTLTPAPASEQPGADTPVPSPAILGTYDRAAALARMQTLRREGYSFGAIATQLTREGMVTRYGQAWQESTVRYLLRKEGWTP